MLFAILLSSGLGILYLFNFFTQKNDQDIILHLKCVISCSPFIFLTGWLFYQTARTTRLAEIYSYKANLGFTIKDAIDYVSSIEGDLNNKHETIETLHELLFRLYEIPVGHEDNKGITMKTLGKIANVLKEVKELVTSIKGENK